MKRWLLRICVLLVLGAIVNVAVAWGLAMPPARRSIPEPFAVPEAWPGKVDNTWPLAERGSVFCTFGIRYFVTGGAETTMTSPRHEYWQELVQYGLPKYSMEVERIEDMLVTWPPYQVQSQQYMQGGLVFSSSGAWSTRFLPLRPIWPGFAINTVFYALVLWLLFAAPFALRKRRRIKRGLCPKCAYDLRGSDALVCPECGTGVSKQKAETHEA